MLPGTGGLTRITDKRKIRRDRCDVVPSLARRHQGGKRAVEWNLVDAVAPLSKWDDSVAREARALADAQPARAAKACSSPHRLRTAKPAATRCCDTST
ncbi:MAG: hypothetical protein R3E96_10635 [Planctomycetota bacterium]